MNLTIKLNFVPGTDAWLDQIEEQLLDNLTPSQVADLIARAAGELCNRALSMEEAHDEALRRANGNV